MTSNELPPLINKRRVGAPRTSLFSALAPLECMHSSLASATITDGVLTEEDVLRRSRAASLDTVKHLTIYGAGSEHHTLPEDPCAPPPALTRTLRWSLRTAAPVARGSARRIHRVPADPLRDALARRKSGGHHRPRHWLRPYSRRGSTPCEHCLHTGGPQSV